jgi:hypothetical protein
MSELNDSAELHLYSSAVLYVLSAISLPHGYVEVILGNFVRGIKSSEVSPVFAVAEYLISLPVYSPGVSDSKPYPHLSYSSTAISCQYPLKEFRKLWMSYWIVLRTRI